MPVPKRKTSKARRNKRNANKGIAVKSFTVCSNASCDRPIMPHQACLHCGFYKGKKVLEGRADRAARRRLAKQNAGNLGSEQQAA